MARKKKTEPPQSAHLTPDIIKKGIVKLQRRITELENFDISTVEKRWDAKITALTDKINNTLAEIFGHGTVEYNNYHIYDLCDLPIIMGGGPDPIYEVHESYTRGIKDAIVKMNSVKEILEEKLQDIAPQSSVEEKEEQFPNNGQIFVVHGHDELVKQSVARFLEKLNLNPVILHEQPNQGKTLIEKLETHSALVDFAVVLLTPDDKGYPANEPEKIRDRARQNVILELGLFVGILGRGRVCALYKGDLEIPSDYAGVVYIPLDESDGWKLSLAREIKQVIDIDLNKAI